MVQGWRMPDGPSWDHPLSGDFYEKPRMTSAGFELRFKILGRDEMVVFNVSDPEDEDEIDEGILLTLENMELIDEVQPPAYWVSWADPKHPYVRFRECQEDPSVVVLKLEQE